MNVLSLIAKGILKHPDSNTVITSYIKDSYRTSGDKFENESHDYITYSHLLTSFFQGTSQGSRTSESYFLEPQKSNLEGISKSLAKITGTASAILSPINNAVNFVKDTIVDGVVAIGKGIWERGSDAIKNAGKWFSW